MAVVAYQNRYGIRVLSEVPWLYWIGDPHDNFGSLMGGDWPHDYYGFKAKQMIENTTWEIPE